VTATGEELWTYGGVRVSSRGQRVYAWIDHAGEELWFPKTGTHAAVGSQYKVTVKRADGVTSIIGTRNTLAEPATTTCADSSGHTALGSHHAPGVDPRRAQ
jgi:hypothetical protein